MNGALPCQLFVAAKCFHKLTSSPADTPWILAGLWLNSKLSVGTVSGEHSRSSSLPPCLFTVLQELSQQPNLQKAGLALASCRWFWINSSQVFFRFMFFKFHFSKCLNFSSLFTVVLQLPILYLFTHDFLSTSAAIVGERLVSVCSWEGGATMRSIPTTVSKSLLVFLQSKSNILCSGGPLQF